MNQFKTTYWKPILHVFAWVLLLLMPALAGLQSQSPHFHIPARDLWRMGFLCAVFYLNYLWLIPKYFLHGNRIFFVLANLAFAGIMHFIMHGGAPPPLPPNMIRPPRFHEKPALFFVFTSFMLVFLTTGMAIATRMTEQWFRHQKNIALQETEHLKSELSYLKLQLSPHFLLNTLNNIYSLTSQDSEKAQKAILHLGKLLKYLLYETEDELVSLQGEIGFMKSYIELMTLRTGKNVHIESSFAEVETEIKIAPLVFLPILENAFKHGTHPTQESSISISMTVHGFHVQLSTINSNNPKNQEDRSGSGVGLSNLKKRLELIYPGKYQYSTNIENGNYQCLLGILTES